VKAGLSDYPAEPPRGEAKRPGLGEYEGRAKRRRDTCIVVIAVLDANAVETLGFVPGRKPRTAGIGAPALPLRVEAALRGPPGPAAAARPSMDRAPRTLALRVLLLAAGSGTPGLNLLIAISSDGGAVH
jgi:hypothetical protein